MAPLNLNAALRKAAQNLEDSVAHFEQSPPGLAQELVELKLQACIFQYDVCYEMVSLLRSKPTGFAASVALKGLVLRLYEYDDLINTSQIPRLLALAAARDIPFTRESIKDARQQWKTELAKLKKWKDVRNEAAGHYGRDLRKQVVLLRSLDVDEVMTVVRAFLSFNMSLLANLRDAGRGGSSDT